MSLRSADKKFVWHPYTQMNDWNKWDSRVIVKGEGFYLVDSEDRRYLDGIASMWCNVWGHGQNSVVDAMVEQLKNLQHSTLFGLANGPSAELAEKLAKLAKGMDRTFYTDNGSTAIEAAMKMALQYWRNKGKGAKREFISLEHGYHGDTVGAMSVGYIEKFFGAYKSLLAKVHRVPNPLLYGSRIESEKELVEQCLEKTERLLKKRGDKCAALVMESGAQIAGGVVIYPEGYQRKIAKMCKDNDVLLVLDEIATGFGRLGSMIEYLDQRSQPDIVCFGKALTGGYFPLAVTMTTERIFNAFLGKYSDNKQFYHGHTFTGHPVGCAAALANIELYEKRGLVRQINENARYIATRLHEFAKSSIVADIRHKGLLVGIELARNAKPVVTLKNRERINYFVMHESLQRGVHLRSLGNILMVIPPLAIGRRDLGKLLDVQLEVLRKVERLS
jgi:adenosylmethionine---8-amino-7-oxononanoate aminotransferase